MVLFPFVTDVLVRTYAWMVILGPAGALNNALGSLGIQPAHLLYDRAGVLIGMTYALLPYMVLTLYSVLRNIDQRLVLAATSLGAGAWQAFRTITIPLSLSGVYGGSLLVFVLSLGYFATPRLMGGATDQTLALAIDQQFEQSLNWGFASALTVVLLVMTLIGFALYLRWIGLRSLLQQGHHA
jgi:putative spermidine/putrescine transport system permease protein